MYTEIIEFPSRKALAANLHEFYGKEGVVEIDVIDLGRTLRVTREGDEPEDVTVDPEAVDNIELPPVNLTSSGTVEPANGDPIVIEGYVAPEPEAIEPEEASTGSVEDPEEAGAAPAPADEDEDLLGAPADPKPEITNATTRDELREIVAKYDLGVDIPTAGPLQPLRDRIAAALAK